MQMRKYAGSATRLYRAPRGTKIAASKGRLQMALRPPEHLFHLIAAWAAEWGVSWNEAAIRLIELGAARVRR